MSLLQTQRDIETHFDTNWTETPIVYQNVAYNEVSEFIRLTVLSSDRSQCTMGCNTNLYRTTGVLVIQIFCPLNMGTKRILTIVDLLVTLLQSNVIGSAKFKTPYISFQGSSDVFYQVNLSCPYYTDNIQ